MIENFPPKYFLIFANNPEDTIHKNNMNAGLRLGLTLVMEEYKVHVLLTEQAILLAKKRAPVEQKTIDQYSSKEKSKLTTNPNFNDEDESPSFTPYELIDGLISFGAHVMTCKSSLTLMDLKEEEIIEGVEIIHLHNAVKIMQECTQTLVF